MYFMVAFCESIGSFSTLPIFISSFYKTVPQETVLDFRIVMYDKQTTPIWCIASLKLNILFDEIFGSIVF